MNNFHPKFTKMALQYLQDQLVRVKNQHKVHEVIEQQKKKPKGLSAKLRRFFLE
ncbi:hypothetical protein [Sulfurimonas paralvinellae]|uniref:hypothetical protein n=1 Tax=Sulfurimonas paralvinellae TaxID=317658 RepID=UPI0018661CFE|nr:hypothetical protein [Sulfurimonas paralvinellae]